jgi:hypothetical protein
MATTHAAASYRLDGDSKKHTTVIPESAEPQRSQKLPKPPKPRKVEKRRKGRKG